VVRTTVYRAATFEGLIAKGNWDLSTPFVAHGVTVTDQALEFWLQGEAADAATANAAPPAPVPEENTEGIAEVDNSSLDVSDAGVSGGIITA
jgi:hypothetical protein